MSSSTTVSQKSSEISNKEMTTTSHRNRFKRLRSMSHFNNKDIKDDNADINNNDIQKDYNKSEKQKDKKELENIKLNDAQNQIITCVDNKLVLFKETVSVITGILFNSYNNILDIPNKILYLTKYANEEISKVLTFAEEITNVLVSRLWNMNVRSINITTLNGINMGLYRRSPSRTAYGKSGALEIWKSYGIWTSESADDNLTELYKDLKEILEESELTRYKFVVQMLNNLEEEISQINSENSIKEKMKKIEQSFGINFANSLCIYKEVCDQINRDGFDHELFANNFFNESSLYPQHNASSKISEWTESVLEIIKENSNSSFLPVTGDGINKVIPHEYQSIVMSSYANSKLSYECTPPKILTKQLLQSSIFRKLLLASLINKMILSLSNQYDKYIVEIKNDVLEDTVKCIIASLFKNFYRKNTKIRKEFEDSYNVLKNSLIEKIYK